MLEDDAAEDTLSIEEMEARKKAVEAEAARLIAEEKYRLAVEAAQKAAAAQLRRQQEMVRSAAIGRRAQVSILMSEGATPDFMFQGRTALSAAAEGGHVTTVIALLQAGADFATENQNSSFPPIVAAAFEGHRSVVKTLLEYGDDPNRASSAGGMTALICAAMRGYTDTIQLLLDYHADPNQRDDVACTPVMRAAAEGRGESIKLLVENGRADWTLSAMGGLSAMTWAASKGHRDIVAMLKKYDELWAAATSEGEFYILFKKDDSEDAVLATL